MFEALKLLSDLMELAGAESSSGPCSDIILVVLLLALVTDLRAES